MGAFIIFGMGGYVKNLVWGFWHCARIAFGCAAVISRLANCRLANAIPLNGQGTGEISDRFDIYFVPAGYVFSILNGGVGAYRLQPGQ